MYPIYYRRRTAIAAAKRTLKTSPKVVKVIVEHDYSQHSWTVHSLMTGERYSGSSSISATFTR